MLSQDYSSPAAVTEAKIKQYVGQFLSQESPLITLSNSRNISVQTEARKLYNEHKSLDTNLQKALKIIDNIKAGAYSIGDVLTLGTFATQFGLHINKSAKFLKSQGMTTASALPKGDTPTGGGLLALAVGAFGIFPAIFDFFKLRKKGKI